MNYQENIKASVQYLSSPEAVKSLAADAYWPKWHSPWWHMLLLHEMGETRQIPAETIKLYVESMKRIPLKIFPILPEEMPEGLDPYRGSPCHCQLGNVYQVLSKYGVDVDTELPWIRPWFLKYQMADGGLNCDEGAYLVKHECPSSMVGTIAAFEAVLLYTNRPYTDAEKNFLEKGADFLIKRKLMLGSSTVYNASERESAVDWVKLCFPRFYLYDVLRGLNALTIWAEKFDRKLSKDAVSDVVSFLMQRFTDGAVVPERFSFEDTGTILQNEAGEWVRKQPATFFPLLNQVSALGEVSPFLSKQWLECQSRLSVN